VKISQEQLNSLDVPSQACVRQEAPSELVMAIKDGNVPRASELAGDLLSRAADDPEALMELANGYFAGPLPAPGPGAPAGYAEVFERVRQASHDLIVGGSLGDEKRSVPAGARALELLAYAEKSDRDPADVKARAMAALSSATSARRGSASEALRYSKEEFVNSLTSGDAQARLDPGGISDRIAEASRSGPVRISGEGVQVYKENKLPLQNYELTRVIGHGVSGNVALARHTGAAGETKTVVVKKIALSPGKEREQVDAILRESAIQMYLFGDGQEPYVCELKKAIVCKNELYIVLDPADASLEGHVQKNPANKQQLLGIFHDLAGSYGEMHQAGFLHKDIKADNVLKKGDKLLVSDFGLSKPLDSPGQRVEEDARRFGLMMLEMTEGLPPEELSARDKKTLASLKNDFGMYTPAKVQAHRTPSDPTTVDRIVDVAKDMYVDDPQRPMDRQTMKRAQQKLWEARVKGALDRLA
jgi:hypothetical protein